MNNLPPPLTLEMLTQFAQGNLDATQSGMILQLALQYPEVAAAVDQLKRKAVDKVIADAKAMDPQAYIATGNLEAYIQGSLSEPEQQMVELMVQLHPEIKAEMDALEDLNALLILESTKGVTAPERSKQRLLNFMDATEEEGAATGLFLCLISTANQAATTTRPGSTARASRRRKVLKMYSFNPSTPARNA